MQEKKDFRSYFKCILYLILMIIVINLFKYFRGYFTVSGSSMYPTLKDGQKIITTGNYGSIERGDIMIFQQTEKLLGVPIQKKLIKRVIGLPGDIVQVENNQILINGQIPKEPEIQIESDILSELNGLKIQLKEDEYYVLGDNLAGSRDSRAFGPVSKDAFCQKYVKTVP